MVFVHRRWLAGMLLLAATLTGCMHQMEPDRFHPDPRDPYSLNSFEWWDAITGGTQFCERYGEEVHRHFTLVDVIVTKKEAQYRARCRRDDGRIDTISFHATRGPTVAEAGACPTVAKSYYWLIGVELAGDRLKITCGRDSAYGGGPRIIYRAYRIEPVETRLMP